MTPTPSISVVVSTRDRAERLGALLDALRRQDLERGSFEVMVVDNGSTDDTVATLERAKRAGEVDLRWISAPSAFAGNVAAARNAGWRAASAPLVAFTDDDCEPDRRWLSVLLEAADEHSGTILQGRTEPIPSERERLGPFSRTQSVNELGPYFQTCNVCYPRGVLEAVDGFDQEGLTGGPSAEDADLAWRAIATGVGARFVPDALVYHAVHELGPLGKLRLAARWGDIVRVYGRHPEMRALLHNGVFWKQSHQLLLVAAVGVLFARRNRLGLLLGLPYAWFVARYLRARGWPLAVAPYIALHDLVELVTLARGSIRHRRLML